MTTTAEASGLPPVLSRALSNKGYTTLTEVQEAMLAEDLAGRDLLVSAQTGSGKTVAFGLAFGGDILEDGLQLPHTKAPIALVVAPTRELALQVAKELTWLYAEAGVRIATCVGGMDVRGERQALARGAHIVVGTPGRLVDHITRHALKLQDLRVAVLDEADEMLKLGFREELEAILEECPDDRRTLMFSATVGGGIGKLAGRYQNDALRVSVSGPTKQHDDIKYQAMIAAQYDSERAIINALRFHEAENAIVFCSTRAAVARLTSRLANRGFSVVSLSGELSQQERTNALQAMRDGRARVCVATDVAARGIDLPGLELVIHADLPKDREGLLHRSGRTGRAGRKGTSILVVPPRAQRRVERLLGDAKVRADWISPPSADDVRRRDDERLLSDPALTEPGELNDLAKIIAESYSAEHLAAAIVRLHQAGRSAPEEISEVQPASAPRERKPRVEIENGVWVSLSVGRSSKAEARWILPMLCKAGPMQKSAIGAIRVREHETFVHVASDQAQEFLIRVGRGAKLEGDIEARLAEGPPGPEERGARSATQRRPAKPHPKTGTRDRDHARGGRPDKRSRGPRDHSAPREAREPAPSEKPWRPEANDEPVQFARKPKKTGKPYASGPAKGPAGDVEALSEFDKPKKKNKSSDKADAKARAKKKGKTKNIGKPKGKGKPPHASDGTGPRKRPGAAPGGKRKVSRSD